MLLSVMSKFQIKRASHPSNASVWYVDITSQKARAVLTKLMDRRTRLPRAGNLLVLPTPGRVFLTNRGGGYSLEGTNREELAGLLK